MPLKTASFLNRSLLPHGAHGVAGPIPADVRRELQLQSGEKVDLEYDREERTLTYHFSEPNNTEE